MFSNKWMAGMPAALVIASALPLVAQSALVDGFKDPPNIARPRVYWYWQNGNITSDGLSKDLEWMHRAGIGGVETFDVAVVTPTVVKNRIIYMQPEWKDAFLHSLEVSERLGMTVTIGAAPGWSQTGGPWIKPIDAMKKLVWTETRVEGGKPFSGILAKPPQINGPFQDQPHDVRPDRPIPALPTLYKDQLVIAFRAPPGENTLEEAHPMVTASGGSMTYVDLIDGSYGRTIDLPATAGSVSWVQIAFDSPQTIRGVTVATHGVLRAFTDDAVSPQTLEVSDDGVHFRRVIDMPRGNLYQRTYAFAPVKGRYFRYRLPMVTADTIKLARFQLHTATPVNRAEEQPLSPRFRITMLWQHRMPTWRVSSARAMSST
jgi:hypothetical protein